MAMSIHHPRQKSFGWSLLVELLFLFLLLVIGNTRVTKTLPAYSDQGLLEEEENEELVVELPRETLQRQQHTGKQDVTFNPAPQQKIIIDQGAYTYYYYYFRNNTNDTSTAQSTNDDSNLVADHRCRTVLFLGVGTAMQTTDYSQLAAAVFVSPSTNSSSSSSTSSSSSMVVIVVDPNPSSSFGKQDSYKLAALIRELTSKLHHYVPICATSSSREASSSFLPRNILVGGHSAGGQGAVGALPLLLDSPDDYDYYSGSSTNIQLAGFVGLAPFRISDNNMHMMQIAIPSNDLGLE